METQNISNDHFDGEHKNDATRILDQVVSTGPKNSSSKQEGKEVSKMPPDNGQSEATKSRSRSSTRRTSKRKSRYTKIGSGLQQESSPSNHKQNVRTFFLTPKILS